MNIRQTICCYCRQPRTFSTDLHGCEESLKAQAYLASVIEEITTSMQRPGNRELTSGEMKNREDRRHQYATVLNIMERPVRPEYKQNGIE